MSTGRPNVSVGEQEENVRQLLRDRKNWLGGHEEGIKDFAEMGAHQGGNWPLSAESIRRQFGVAKNKEDRDNSEYVSLLRAGSHAILEEKLVELKLYAFSLWQAVTQIYPEDGAGDKDYDWYAAKAKRNVPLRRVLVLKDTKLYKSFESIMYARGVVTRCDLGVKWITQQLMDEELFVTYAQRRTVKEEGKIEDQNMSIYLRYKELKQTRNPDTGKLYTTGQAYRQMEITERLTRGYMERVVEAKEMEVEGRPKRKRGRPKTKK